MTRAEEFSRRKKGNNIVDYPSWKGDNADRADRVRARD